MNKLKKYISLSNFANILAFLFLQKLSMLLYIRKPIKIFLRRI
ncbi:MAG: Hypothetical protein LKU_02203 [Lactobacillus kefiranofaciens]